MPYIADENGNAKWVDASDPRLQDSTIQGQSQAYTGPAQFDMDTYLEDLRNQIFNTQQANMDFLAGLGQGAEGPSAVDEVRRLFPWAEELGLMDLISDEIKRDTTPEGLIQVIRDSDAYKQRFPGIEDADGTRRMNERQYLDTVQAYRDVLKEFGAFDQAEDTPMHYGAFFDLDLDPNELRDRLNVYQQLEEGSADLRDTFYVYAGLDVSVDDLYRSTVDPTYRTELTQAYNEAVSGSAFDYEKFITRATERGLQRVSELLGQYKDQGLITGQVVSKLLATNPDFAREVMAAIYTSGTNEVGEPGVPMALSDLLTSFDLAMIASAATESGLEMPTKERAQQLASAGVSRAQALQSYGTFSSRRNLLQGIAQRANVLDDISQDLWEEATLLARGEATVELERAVGTEQALSQAGGGFARDSSGAQVGRR